MNHLMSRHANGASGGLSVQFPIPLFLGLLWAGVLVVSAAGFAAAFPAAPYYEQGLEPPGQYIRFLLDEEKNLPTRFVCVLLLLASLHFLLVRQARRSVVPTERLCWMILAIGFVAMALDEYYIFHEELILPLRAATGLSDEELGPLFFAWVIVAIPLVALAAVYFLPRVLRLPPLLRNGLLLAGTLYLGGAIGMEMIDGAYRTTHSVDLVYLLLTSVEETLEMAGVATAITTMALYLRRFHGFKTYSVGLAGPVVSESADEEDERPIMAG